MMRRYSWIALVAMLTLILATSFAVACGDDDDDDAASPTATTPTDGETATAAPTGDGEPSGEPIKVGVIYPSTGRFASFFPFLDNAVKAAVDKVNEDGGVLGRPFEFVHEDDQSEGPQAVIAARGLASRDDIVAISPTGTVAFLATNGIGDDLAVPMVVNSSAANLEEGFEFSDWMFRYSLRETGENVAKMLGPVVEDSGAQTAARMFDTGNESQVSGTEAAADAFEIVGLDEVGVEQFRAGDVDFSAQLTNLINADPDIVYLSGTADEISLIVEQANDRSFFPLWVGAGGMADASTFDTSGGATVGVVAMAQWDPSKGDPEGQEFLDRYTQYDTDGFGAISQSAVIYDVILLMADAIERAGSTDREAVRDAIAETSAFPGVTGPITFQGPGDNLESEPQIIIMNGEGAFVTYDAARLEEYAGDRLP